MKKSRTAHILLLAVLVGQFAFSKILGLLELRYSVTGALILSQLTILVPFGIYCVVTRKNPLEIIRFKKINMISVFMAFLVAIFSYPIVIFLNMVSMLFVENAVVDIMPSVLELGIGPALLLMAVTPAVVEETIFRGTLYNTYSKSNPVAGLFLSAVLFGLMHMNFNQLPYAIYIGIIAVLMLEACDSILAPMIIHLTMNGSSTVLAFITTALQGEEALTQTTNFREALIESFKLSAKEMALPFTEAQIDEMGALVILISLAAFAVFAIIALAFVLIFVYIAFCVNKRKPKEVFKKPESIEKRGMVDIWLVIFTIYTLYECFSSMRG